jgi:hypothetical protein
MLDKTGQSVFYYISSGSARGSEEVVTSGEQSGSCEMIISAPGCSLTSLCNCPHLRSGLPVSFCNSFLVMKMLLLVLSFLKPKVTGGERLRASERNVKWRQGCQALLLLLINLRAPVRSRCL